MIYLEVAVAAPIYQPLTYKLPEHIDPTNLAPGLRLLVPLGNRLVTGYLLAVTDTAPPSGRLKSIADLLDPEPLFPAEMIPFFRWLADYYLHPIGEVIKGALPGGLTTESGRTVTLTDAGRLHLAALTSPDEETPNWLATLLAKGKLPPSAVRRIWKKEERQLRRWQEQDFLTIDT
ncbi:primosomal protein N', partial [Thermodesulfobacteriota bacterium]